MTMEPEADHLPDEEEVGVFEEPEHSPSKRQRTERQGSEPVYSGVSSSNDETGFQEARSSQKRRAMSIFVEPVLKRHKGVFNNNYLDLLNRDIGDFAGIMPVDGEDFPPSQIGLTLWAPYEKKVFFEALSRLGKDNIRGISDRIRTKSDIEVRQYISLLEDAIESRGQEQEGGLKSLGLEEYPAAVEISQPCCHALDEAADALSFRQERHEELAEQKKWGDCWNINLELAKRIEGDHGLERDPTFASDHGLEFTELLRVKSFVRLPERIFMNASHAENNWQFVSEEPPTIRATALQDFHSLLISVTKRLVLSTLFIAESRIRGKRRVVPSTRNLVRRKDVEAAVASLGMKQNSDEFWVTCARRLRLEVWDDEDEEDAEEEDNDKEPMVYDNVENILRSRSDAPQDRAMKERSSTPEINFEDRESSDSAADETSGEEGSDDDEADAADLDDAEREVIEEAKEVLVHSAYDFPKTHRTREALKNTIRHERAQEAQAEAEDAKTSYEAELELWRLLQRQPPESLMMPQVPEHGRRAFRGVGDLYDAGRKWRERLTYHSEWEMLGTSQVQDKGR
ncbi:RNA polymerase I-specific transcription initiation factor rrn5 [Colletotrichum shisoi]|uniref:RNA polymerase I-specific transcription initiation factor rrn5 n=1 Tax=Colletotrichum shisoi TaxID=2078593 RepID=A0A5Q4C5D7_9PEZI|nr:RNA polymerase I-specific transcription initiation factor rrn5 [Colletotrichum shisoi]